MLCLFLGSSLNYILPDPEKVFVYVYSASVLPAMMPWFVVLLSQGRFRRANAEAMKSHPFKSILFPYANYLTLAFLACVLVGMAINEDTQVSLMVGVAFLALVSIAYYVFGLNKIEHPLLAASAASRTE